MTVKLPALVAVPNGVVSVTLPVVAPLGTTAVTCVTLTNVKLADVPLNLTELTPENPVPLIVTTVPTFPLVGERSVIRGPVIVNVPLLVAVPALAVTEIRPVVAPLGTVAVILVTLTTVKLVAAVPLNLTAVTPVNPVPLIVTTVPTFPLLGEKLLIARPPPPPPVTLKLALLVPVPFGVVTEMGPVVAPFGTVVEMLPGPTTVKPATGVPLNATDVAPVKFAP